MKWLFVLILYIPFFLHTEEELILLDQQSIEVFREAAEEGNANCQLVRGLFHEVGIGGNKDLNKAARWYWHAACQGNPRAQKRLGILYSQGQGVLQDKVYGMSLVLLGSFYSETYWIEFGSIRDELAKELTKKTIY